MKFTWHEPKRISNLKKHGLDFADAEQVFSGPTMTQPDHRFHYEEARFSTLGMLGARVIMISHTETGDEIHVISMRKAERYEQESYFNSFG
jgi:uncharacterized DUF497 family protein